MCISNSTEAKNLLNKMCVQFNGEYMGGKCAIDNDSTINFMNDNCVEVVELCGQETWVQSDGSYITRNDDLYFEGSDITDFEIIDDEQKAID